MYITQENGAKIEVIRFFFIIYHSFLSIPAVDWNAKIAEYQASLDEKIEKIATSYERSGTVKLYLRVAKEQACKTYNRTRRFFLSMNFRRGWVLQAFTSLP